MSLDSRLSAFTDEELKKEIDERKKLAAKQLLEQADPLACEIKRLHSEGHGTSEISQFLIKDRSDLLPEKYLYIKDEKRKHILVRQQVSYYMRKLGLKSRFRTDLKEKANERKQEFLALRNQDLSFREIGERLNVSPSRAREIIISALRAR